MIWLKRVLSWFNIGRITYSQSSLLSKTVFELVLATELVALLTLVFVLVIRVSLV